MAALTTQNVVRTGIVPTYAAAAGGGDTFIPSADTFLHIKNGSGGSLTVTVAVTATVIGQAASNVAVAIAAGAEKMIGPFPYEFFNQSDGTAAVTYSGVTSLTVAVLKLAKP